MFDFRVERGNITMNILFIMADDQGSWAMNCGGTKELYTPNMDRIAKSGVQFDNFYCVSPVCSPARASVLTGDIPSSHGVHDWIRSGNIDAEKFQDAGKENPYWNGYSCERKPISYLEGKTTYTDVLEEHGYTCALSGKWHLGDSVTPQHGFSKWYTIGLGGCEYFHPDIVENGDIHVLHDQYVTNVIADKAIEYLDEFKNKENPFYLSVHFTAPHAPWGKDQHPKKWIDYYENCDFPSIPDVPDHENLTTGPVYHTEKRKENLRGYFAAISAMDEQIGRILDTLEANGQRENTLVIYTADNGMSMGHHGVWGKGNGTFPFNMYETSVKVPLLISMPGTLLQGVKNEAILSAYDLFPTLLELCGISSNACEKLPGTSFAKLLSGEKKTEKEEQEVVVFDEYGPVRMIRNKDWKYIHRYPYGPHELYHLTSDPEELENLYGKLEYEEIVVDMRKHLQEWFLKYADEKIDGTREGVTGLGQMCKAGMYSHRVDTYCCEE